MTKKMRLTAGVSALALTAALAAGCGSYKGGNGRGSGPDNGKGGNADCGYSWNPCPSSGASAPQGGVDRGTPNTKAALPTSGPIRWGDWKFGECSLSLWPAYLGLTLQPSGHLVILASTACVGYQPQEMHIHITLQRWWKPGGATKSDWHDTGVTLADNTPPPLVLLPPEGEPPLSHQHQIKTAVRCTPNDLSKAVPYRLRIDIIGVSYGGEPIVTGGYASALIVTNWDCLQ